MTKEEAKKILKELHEDGLFSVRIALETFFPEFKVDYDEMVRKELIEFIDTNTLSTDERHSRWIAWLEKVKDFDKQLEEAYKNSDEVQYKRGYDDGYLEGIVSAKKELKKHKPTVIDITK